LSLILSMSALHLLCTPAGFVRTPKPLHIFGVVCCVCLVVSLHSGILHSVRVSWRRWPSLALSQIRGRRTDTQVFVLHVTGMMSSNHFLVLFLGKQKLFKYSK
jgi:hypothetical protein